MERECTRIQNSNTNAQCLGMCALKKNIILLSRSMQETIRIINAKKAEEKHGEKKMNYKHDFVDKEARNSFNPKTVTVSMMKCAHRHNHFGLRDSLINNNMIEAHCPRCQEIET